MDAFSYLSVLISIILALGMTRVLAGVGEMLQARSHRRIYWVHALWIVNLFLYLVSMLLFPREGDVDLAVDYKTHYYANHRAFFILFALFTPVDIVDTLLKGIPHFLEQGWRYDISIAAALTGLTIAAITRNERYHQFYAIFFLIQTVIISFAIFHTLV